ncbi:uncharacterized protein LOC107274780 [Cephus cinctus]|uniref:Uncharacterized protein LOC107274780 n=1 Tax=Cephus cinctus TaxID=211228 RepID=A0AAJ7W7Y0_CEPCN|nr:uncharacterized protein LOC107274780 [Cephus cinctus]
METVPKKRDIPKIISIERVPDNLKKKSIILAESDITKKDEHKKAATLNQISVTTKSLILNREQNASKNYDGRRDENPTSERSKGAIPKAALSDVDTAVRKSNPRKDTRDESQKNALNDIEKSTKIKYLQDAVNNLSQALSDKDLVMMDLLNANIALQKNAIEELQQLKAMISNLQNLNVEHENGAQSAVRFISEETFGCHIKCMIVQRALARLLACL